MGYEDGRLFSGDYKGGDMKNIFQSIIDICNQNIDNEGTLKEIRLKAMNRVIRYEWEELYGIKLDGNCRLAESDYCCIDDYQGIYYYQNGYKCKEAGRGRSITWSEGNKQPVDEWLYLIRFNTGAYIFGEDYNSQKQLFQDFFDELRTYKPDYEDLHNHYLYWKIENAKKIMSQFQVIFNKYKDKNNSEVNGRKIKKLERELAILKIEAI